MLTLNFSTLVRPSCLEKHSITPVKQAINLWVQLPELVKWVLMKVAGGLGSILLAIVSIGLLLATGYKYNLYFNIFSSLMNFQQ